MSGSILGGIAATGSAIAASYAVSKQRDQSVKAADAKVTFREEKIGGSKKRTNRRGRRKKERRRQGSDVSRHER